MQPGVGPIDRCSVDYLVQHLLQTQARGAPGREALVEGATVLTYAEVETLSNRLGNALQEMGVRRGDRVATFFRKSIDEVIAVFGILKAGAVFVPVNPLLLPPQISHILNDCRVTAVITDPAGLGFLKEAFETVDSLRFVLSRGPGGAQERWRSLDLAPILAGGNDDPPRDLGLSIDLASIIYTSGSTGRSKGVMLSHGNILASARLGSSYLRNTPEDRILSILPFSFDYGLFQLMSAFLHGACLVLCRFRFSTEIVEVLRRERISGMGGVPTLWALLTEKRSPLHQHRFPHLRYVTNSGAALPQAVLRALRTALPETRIYLMYGMTEAFRTTFLPPEEIDRRAGSIGKPLPDVEIYLVNDKGEPCAPEEIGELLHRGPTVSMGYWGQPEATDRAFRPNPFAPPELRHVEKVYYSGDLVKMDADGFLYFIGRRDAQLKCSGYRVSPTEVEEVLYETGLLREVAVIGIPDELLGHTIRAFVALRDGQEVRVEELLDLCGRSMPRYMIPRRIDILDELPKTGSGKINYPLLRLRAATPEEPRGND
jgi:acyl-CoA ligase (AMP-forming) (exosortase A-associated)